MYSLPQVYGDKPFDANKYLPSCMYAAKPYYVDESGQTLPSMASILPLPLLPTDLDLKDSNIKHTLDDILSRQMLLLCRLNQLEEQLLSQQQNQSTVVPAFESPKRDVPVSGQHTEDYVIHFNLSNVPYSLFALANVLRKQYPVMVNLHVHSSAQGQQGINQAVTGLRNTLHSSIGFQATSSEQYLTRSQFPVIVTFIVTSAKGAEPYAAFAAGKNVIQGELAIAKHLVELLAPSESSQSAASIWSTLTSSQTLASDKAILEQLGPLVFNVSESQFVLQQASPALLDVVLWSLTVPEFGRGATKVASSLRGTQLLNAKWQSAVRQYVFS